MEKQSNNVSLAMEKNSENYEYIVDENTPPTAAGVCERGSLIEYVEVAQDYRPGVLTNRKASREGIVTLQAPSTRPSFYQVAARKSPSYCEEPNTDDDTDDDTQTTKKRKSLTPSAAFQKWAYKAQRISNRKSKGKKLPTYPEIFQFVDTTH